MKWIGIFLVSPLWGALSTQLFLQTWLAALNFVICLIGFVRGAVPRKNNALGMGVALLSSVLFSALLDGGFWLLTDIFSFGRTRAENIVYWIVAALSLLYMLPQIPSRIRKAWRSAMTPGWIEMDILKRKVSAISSE